MRIYTAEIESWDTWCKLCESNDLEPFATEQVEERDEEEKELRTFTFVGTCDM